MFETILSAVYYLVAVFYLVYGVLLLIVPQRVLAHIPRFFPLLASFRYHPLQNSINLVAVGALLLVVGKLIGTFHPGAVFTALVLSGLEVYLGIQFYYREERDVPQAVGHVALHTALALSIGWLLLTHYTSAIASAQHGVANVVGYMGVWTSY